MISGATLDHVALAVERWEDAWPRYAEELGGRWVGGGLAVGFAAHQVVYANGAKVELIRPHEVERNDFLRRFIDRHGPGPHHLTFKVPDIVAALGEAEAAGYRPVNVDLTDEQWKEAFLHPKDAPGVVVQVAQSSGDWATPPPPGFPSLADAPATLAYVAHAVADPDEGLALFAGLLGGEPVAEGDGWVELAWAKPGRVRLLHGPAVDDWVGDRRGRVHHLAFGLPGPAAEAVIEPADNLGTRLCVFPA